MKPGPQPRLIYSKVQRISLSEAERDLLPFFEALDKLPVGRRNAALFAAIRGGQGAAAKELGRIESSRSSRVIDALLDTFE